MQLRIDLRQFDASFWRYLASFSLFSLGIVVFAELYPLYLQDRGESVAVIGGASLALNLGCIAGTIPAVILMRSPGLKASTLLSLAGVSVASAARLWHANPLMLYGGAFAAGFFFGVLTVGIAVTISRLTVRSNRALGFSYFFAATIAAGFVGDVIGGELPKWIGHLTGREDSAQLKLVALLLACAISLSSLIPAAAERLPDARQARLRFPSAHRPVMLLVAIGAWNFAVGLFVPFYTLYFSSHLQQSVRTIGLDLAGGQIVGAVFTLFVPALIAARGALRSIRFIMFTAGACSFFLSLSSSMVAVAIGYSIYMGCVAMAQPPLYALLMNEVRQEEQSGASMMNSLVVFSAVAAGGFLGGQLISVLGYPRMLAIAGASCMFAAVVFVVMVKAGSIVGEEPVAA